MLSGTSTRRLIWGPSAGSGSADAPDDPGIPEATVSRLPLYHRALLALSRAGTTKVSSEQLAEMAGVNAAKVRKDLSHFGSYGTRGVGYDVQYLIVEISRELGLTHDWPCVIAGVGNLGQANYSSAKMGIVGLSRSISIDMARSKVRSNCLAPFAFSRMTNTIGLMLEDVANPFSGSVHRAVDDAASKRGVAVFATSLDEDPVREREVARTMIQRRVDGLVIVPTGTDQSYLRPEIEAGLATVFVDRLIGLYMLFMVASVAILVTGLWQLPDPTIRLISSPPYRESVRLHGVTPVFLPLVRLNIPVNFPYTSP